MTAPAHAPEREPYLCSDVMPGLDCSPMAHHSRCRYAGTEVRAMVFNQRQRRLIAALHAYDARQEARRD